MKDNPFILTFGREPIQYIDRSNYLYTIEKDFLSATYPNQVFMITGLRGSGKTVLMTSISKVFEKNDQWIVIDLNPELNMLESLAAQLYKNVQLKKLFLETELNFSFNGLGFSIKKDNPTSDTETIIFQLLEHIFKKNKRLLITIDDVTNNQNIKVFAHTFQKMIRKDYPAFLIMTGLYENINKIQDDKSLTFLIRAPKLNMDPLSLPMIKDSYQKIFGIKDEIAIDMAKMTKGYPYAYQALGYLMWERNIKVIDESLIHEYDYYLEQYVYSKIWEGIPNGEREVLNAMCGTEDISSILTILGMDKNLLSVYRNRLIKRSIIKSPAFGKVCFTLPRFKEFILRNKDFY